MILILARGAVFIDLIKMLTITPKINQAIILASQLHFDKFRKGVEDKPVPYIVHPFSVAFITARYTNDEVTIVSALLHDVLEDVRKDKYSGKDLTRDFGQKIYNIIKEDSEAKDAGITKEKELKTWVARKTETINHLKDHSQASLIVCCADKIHNLQSLVAGLKKYGNGYYKNFNAPEPKRAKYLWYFDGILKELKQNLKNKIVDELEQVYQEFKAVKEN
ncbi:MAG: HD domain-containing protein [Patescibacteria group bacterium]|nr:HD domain-containing protein [Patescibacteria group bacterium]